MESFARLVVLALGAALVVALIREGPGGPTRWVKAKFLGDEGTVSPEAQAAAAITAGGVPVTPRDIENAPPLQANPPGTPTGSTVTTPRTTTTPRSSQRVVCPAGMRLVGSVCVGPQRRFQAGPGRPVGTF